MCLCRHHLFSVFGLISFSVFLTNAANINFEETKYKYFIEGQGLFKNEDDVEILMECNWESQLCGKKNAWFITFYNSSEPDHFVKSLKNLATEWASWKDLISFGAIDCNENHVICNRYNVTKYPSLRYFHENYKKDVELLGIEVESLDKNSILQLLVNEQYHRRAKNLPILIPYEHPDLEHVFCNTPTYKKFAFLVIEGESSTLGAELSLKLHQIPQITIRYSLMNNTKLRENSKFKDFPCMIVISKNHDIKHLGANLTLQEAIVEVENFLRASGLSFHVQNPNKFTQYTGSWFDHPQDSVSEQVNFNFEDAIFQMDLETALRYSLKHEVGRVKGISGKRQEALEEYLYVLAKHFPLGHRGQKFLFELRDFVALESPLDGTRLAQAVVDVESGRLQVFSSPQKWIACKSKDGLRHGYPCGLWKMFHYLTVRAAEKGKRHKNPEKTEVLNALLGYLEYFFECTDCVKYYKHLAVKTDMRHVDSLDSAIMWLWMVHNEINKHDETKFGYQFPSARACPTCKHKNGTWNFKEVLGQIKTTYSKKNIKYDGCDMKILNRKLDIDIILHVVLYSTSFLASLVLFMLVSCAIIKGKHGCSRKSSRKRSCKYHQTNTTDDNNVEEQELTEDARLHESER